MNLHLKDNTVRFIQITIVAYTLAAVLISNIGCASVVPVDTGNIDRMIDVVESMPDTPQRADLIKGLTAEKKIKTEIAKSVTAQQQKIEVLSTDAGKWQGARNVMIIISIIVGIIILVIIGKFLLSKFSFFPK